MWLSYVRCLFVSIPLIVLATIVMGTVSFVATVFDSTGDVPHRVAIVWARILLWVSFIDVRVEGLEKINPRGSYVFVCNHTSLMDIPAILSHISNQFRFFAKKGLFRIPFLGTHLRRAGHLPVDRTSARASLRSMSEGARIIAERHISVLVFPEGGRSPQGLREFREGAAYIATKAGVPAVPLGIVGMRELLPMGSIHIRSGKVVLRVGDPISTSGLRPADRESLTQRLYEEIARLTGENPRSATAEPITPDARH
ncbi:MAG TPA: lysophospholipid acyltransferase family protein [Bryobacteraceae bacterium]|nr:lysophospholipid acyltransferase family protein [Bryobacteraceae bacterium]